MTSSFAIVFCVCLCNLSAFGLHHFNQDLYIARLFRGLLCLKREKMAASLSAANSSVLHLDVGELHY